MGNGKYVGVVSFPGKGTVADYIKFVLKAQSTDKTRYFMNSIRKMEDGRLVATDGRRVHLVKNSVFDCMEPGSWRVVSQKRDEIVLCRIKDEDAGHFPNIDNVISDSEGMRKICHLDFTKRNFNQGVARLFQLPGKRFGVDMDFIYDLMGLEFDFYYLFESKAILLKNIEFCAIIMPLQVED